MYMVIFLKRRERILTVEGLFLVYFSSATISFRAWFGNSQYAVADWSKTG